MVEYHDCDVFKCDSCSDYKSVNQIHEMKAIYTAWSKESQEEFRFYVGHIALCEKCFVNSKKKK